MADEQVRLYFGDCLDVMRGLPGGSVDAIVVDPPYGQTNEAYDGPIAFNPEVWRECYRVAKHDAALISFSASRTYHRIASAIEAGGWRVRQMWGWIYRDGLITSAWPKEGFDRLAPSMDPICFATRGKVLLNLEREGRAWDRETGRDTTRPGYREFGLSNRNGPRRVRRSEGHWPRSLVSDGSEPFEYFAMARTNGGKTGKSGHPNEKPLDVMRWLVEKLPAGCTVLDPFMGSATTGEACLDTGHRFIGIERNRDYFAIAERRLAEARADLALSPA